MKTLYIVRHGKASWDYPELPDVDRPLIEAGMINTKKIIAELNAKHIQVDLIISSHARRAIETARIIAGGINYPIEKIEISKNIYQVLSEDILDIIADVDSNVESLMLVGHNPTFTQFVNIFLKDKPLDILPTSGVIAFTFETEQWDEIGDAKCKTKFTLFPKQLK